MRKKCEKKMRKLWNDWKNVWSDVNMKNWKQRARNSWFHSSKYFNYFQIFQIFSKCCPVFLNFFQFFPILSSFFSIFSKNFLNFLQLINYDSPLESHPYSITNDFMVFLYVRRKTSSHSKCFVLFSFYRDNQFHLSLPCSRSEVKKI